MRFRLEMDLSNLDQKREQAKSFWWVQRMFYNKQFEIRVSHFAFRWFSSCCRRCEEHANQLLFIYILLHELNKIVNLSKCLFRRCVKHKIKIAKHIHRDTDFFSMSLVLSSTRFKTLHSVCNLKTSPNYTISRQSKKFFHSFSTK